jgi:hypothetical protein
MHQSTRNFVRERYYDLGRRHYLLKARRGRDAELSVGMFAEAEGECRDGGRTSDFAGASAANLTEPKRVPGTLDDRNRHAHVFATLERA